MDSRDKRSFDEWKQSNSRSRINGAIVTADYTRNPYVARRGLLYSRNYAREPLDLEVSKPGVKCRGEQSTRLLRVATESARCLILMQRASLLCHAARDCTFLNTNVSFHQKRNPDLHSNVRILSTTISILRTERVGSKPLSLPPSRPFSRFILMEEEQVWINSVRHGKYLRSKIPPFDVSPKEKVTYRSPETKRSRINARLKCRFVFKWLLVSSPEFWDTGRVWKIVEDVLGILQTGMSNY